MDSFIQDTLRSIRRPRDSDFYSDQSPLISTSTKKFTTTSTTDAPAIVSTDCDLPADDRAPPFWPTLVTDNDGASFTFDITDGFVIDHHGGNGNTAALSISYPTGIGTFGGARTAVGISPAYQISIKVVTDKEGDITAVSLEVTAEDIASTNPNPTTSGGTGTGGTFYYKIAVLRPAVGNFPAYLDYYLAGSHIAFRHRGHNLNQRVYVVTICGGVLANSSNHYLCWRNGDYVGKFLSTDSLPAHTGTLDATNVTYISAVS